MRHVLDGVSLVVSPGSVLVLRLALTVLRLALLARLPSFLFLPSLRFNLIRILRCCNLVVPTILLHFVEPIELAFFVRFVIIVPQSSVNRLFLLSPVAERFFHVACVFFCGIFIALKLVFIGVLRNFFGSATQLLFGFHSRIRVVLRLLCLVVVALQPLQLFFVFYFISDVFRLAYITVTHRSHTRSLHHFFTLFPIILAQRPAEAIP
mmetsp:Transcript_12795/g.33861  ORF Transcript_12795/g.33861 Transcript_12795/m.33861 type:complete len:208 (+) Transcript_12795:2154-2777(+)